MKLSFASLVASVAAVPPPPSPVPAPVAAYGAVPAWIYWWIAINWSWLGTFLMWVFGISAAYAIYLRLSRGHWPPFFNGQWLIDWIVRYFSLA